MFFVFEHFEKDKERKGGRRKVREIGKIERAMIDGRAREGKQQQNVVDGS